MSRKLNLVGQKFGMLTVLKESTYKNNTGRSKWLCQCDCGDKMVASGNNLKHGKTTSCGCKRKQFCKDFYQKRELDFQERKKYSNVIRDRYV